MNKTNPIGVRFRADLLEKLKLDHGIESPQKALVFYERFFVNHCELAKDMKSPLRKEVASSSAIPTSLLVRQERPKTKTTAIIPDAGQPNDLLSYNELRDAISVATSSTELHKAWKQVEKNKELASWQVKVLSQLKEDQRSKIDF